MVKFEKKITDITGIYPEELVPKPEISEKINEITEFLNNDNKTAYLTDVGMSGDYNSVIGYKIENPIHGFIKGFRAEGRFEPAEGEAEICGSFIESDDNTGLAKHIESFKL